MRLIIAEKPSVAKSIAAVIGAKERKDGYIEGNGYVVSWCVGHLVSLAPPESYGERYAEKPWKFENLPIMPQEWQFTLNPSTKAQFDILKGLMFRSDADEIICATDAGREGECIFRYVYNYAKCQKPVMRLWTSSLEESAIAKAMDELKPDSAYDNLYAAGLARAKADWLVGMNATRLFSVRHSAFLSVGRVQTPTLAMIVDRNYKVTNFIKEKYFTVELDCGDFIAASEKLDDEKNADDLAALCQGKRAAIASIERKASTQSPPKLYDLTTLQREANRICGYTAQQTLDYTQSLYEQKLVTYPRTDSQFITDDMEQTALDMVGAVTKVFTDFAGFLNCPNVKRCVNNEKVSDHHAIIPTAQILNADLSGLASGEQNVLKLISTRLLLATAQPYKYESVVITVKCENHNFKASGKSIIDDGFKRLEKAVKESMGSKNEQKEQTLGFKQIPQNDTVYSSVCAKKKEHFTSPPKQFTEDTLLSAMETAGNKDYTDDSDVEKKGLGTPATRAGIIETLVKRQYIERSGKKLIPTNSGVALVEAVPNEVKSAKMTADWEAVLQNIERGGINADAFMRDISNFVTELIIKYASKAQSGGFNSKSESIGKCPHCGGDVLKGKFGYYCKEKCGMYLSKVYGKELSESQLKSLLNGKEISYTANGKKTVVLPHWVENTYNGKTSFQWQTKKCK